MTNNCWIKSEERLPDSDVDVLVYFGLGEYIVCHTKLWSGVDFVSGEKYSDIWWVYPVSTEDNRVKKIDRTHWTYLPEPPKLEDYK